MTEQEFPRSVSILPWVPCSTELPWFSHVFLSLSWVLLPLIWKFSHYLSPALAVFLFFLYILPSIVASLLATDTNLSWNQYLHLSLIKGSLTFQMTAGFLSTRSSCWSHALTVLIMEHVRIPTNHPSAESLLPFITTVLPYQVLGLHCLEPSLLSPPPAEVNHWSTPCSFLYSAHSLCFPSLLQPHHPWPESWGPESWGPHHPWPESKDGSMAMNLHYFTLGLPYTWLTQNFFNLLFIMTHFKHTGWYS